MWLSTETIYQSLYVQSRGALRGSGQPTRTGSRGPTRRRSRPSSTNWPTSSGHTADDYDYRGCRGQAEAEAESVAYLVTAWAGLDSGAYTVPYVAAWSAGDTDVVRAAAATVTAAARRPPHPRPPRRRRGGQREPAGGWGKRPARRTGRGDRRRPHARRCLRGGGRDMAATSTPPAAPPFAVSARSRPFYVAEVRLTRVG